MDEIKFYKIDGWMYGSDVFALTESEALAKHIKKSMDFYHRFSRIRRSLEDFMPIIRKEFPEEKEEVKNG